MPIIRVEMFKGRSRDQKRALARELTDAFIRVAGGRPEAFHVVFTDMDKDNWAVGHELMSDRYPDT